MADHETLLERLIPGDLEHQIPAAVEKVLPGGFRNRIVQIGLGLLLAFGFKFLVRRWVEAREHKLRSFARPAAALPPRRPEPHAAPPPAAPRRVVADGAGGIQALLGQPQISLSGPVDQAMYASFRHQLLMAEGPEPLVIAISTYGGDPEVARLMADELRLLRETGGRDAVFLGRVSVYSAGTVLMAAFPVDRRYLTRGTRVLIHERSIGVSEWGSPKTLAATLRSTLREIEHFAEVDEAYYRDLVAGSTIDVDEVQRRAPENWYLDAGEALALRLVHEVI